MVPLLTAGLDEVPPDKLDGASAINNVMQRVSGALGLALLTTFVTSHSAQATADWTSHITTKSMQANAQLTEMMTQGLQALLPYYKLLQLKILAQTYSDLFLVLAVVTALGGVCALTFSSKKPEAGAKLHLDIGG
jgi:hypothetical protein